jgi:hypothetical protein
MFTRRIGIVLMAILCSRVLRGEGGGTAAGGQVTHMADGTFAASVFAQGGAAA